MPLKKNLKVNQLNEDNNSIIIDRSKFNAKSKFNESDMVDNKLVSNKKRKYKKVDSDTSSLESQNNSSLNDKSLKSKKLSNKIEYTNMKKSNELENQYSQNKDASDFSSVTKSTIKVNESYIISNEIELVLSNICNQDDDIKLNNFDDGIMKPIETKSNNFVKKEENLNINSTKTLKKANISILDSVDVNQSHYTTTTIPNIKAENVSNSPVNNKNKYLGAHVSIKGGLFNAIEETIQMGGTAFALFLKSQRTWASKPIENKAVELFKHKLKESGINPNMIVPHGSYLLNCGSLDSDILRKTRDCLLDELLRCEILGLPIYNFHPGSSKSENLRNKSIDVIAETINIVHSKTTSVITVIENMSCQGNTIGGKFSELAAIIDLVKDKSRMGVCLDTCHAFAAGYNIKTIEGYEEMKFEFDSVIGKQYLKAIHLNDSKGDLGCHLDRHANIGKGKIGLDMFKRFMNDPYFDGIPIILETPECDYKQEIDLLYNLCD